MMSLSIKEEEMYVGAEVSHRHSLHMNQKMELLRRVAHDKNYINVKSIILLCKVSA